jgi:hypothetical protein
MKNGRSNGSNDMLSQYRHLLDDNAVASQEFRDAVARQQFRDPWRSHFYVRIRVGSDEEFIDNVDEDYRIRLCEVDFIIDSEEFIDNVREYFALNAADIDEDYRIFEAFINAEVRLVKTVCEYAEANPYSIIPALIVEEWLTHDLVFGKAYARCWTPRLHNRITCYPVRLQIKTVLLIATCREDSALSRLPHDIRLYLCWWINVANKDFAENEYDKRTGGEEDADLTYEALEEAWLPYLKSHPDDCEGKWERAVAYHVPRFYYNENALGKLCSREEFWTWFEKLRSREEFLYLVRSVSK